MITIVEGNENVGKSTFTKMFEQVEHFTRPETWDKDKYFEFWDNKLRQYTINGGNVIFDRSFYSEMVYGPIFRGQSMITKEQMWHFETKYNIQVIHLVRDLRKVHKDCLADDNEPIQGFGDLLKIHIGFNDVFIRMEHKVPIIRLQVSY